MSNSAQIPAAHRLTIVDTVVPTDAADPTSVGQSLQGLNANEFPDGALVYVIATNRLYRLKKSLSTTDVPTSNAAPYYNVVSGVGGPAGGRWVALLQKGAGTLSGGTIAVTGFDLTGTGQFVAAYSSVGGTQGSIRAAKTSDTTATVTSSSGADTSGVWVQYSEDNVTEV